MHRGLPAGAGEPVLSTCPDCGRSSSRASLPHSQATCSWASSSPRPSGSFRAPGEGADPSVPALTRPAAVSGTVCPQSEDPGTIRWQKMPADPSTPPRWADP